MMGMNHDSLQPMQPTNKGTKACTTCAKAKARCIPGPDPNSKCERCQRLKRDCVSRPPVPPRTKKAPKRSRVAELEKRLDELSSHFKGAAKPIDAAAEQFPGKDGKLSLKHLFPTPVEEQGGGSAWPLPGEAEILLQRYHDVYASVFPFVVVSAPSTTAAALMRHKPFLWKAIMMTSCFMDSSRQMKLGRELLADVTGAAYLDDGAAHPLDLLQGLLLLIGWFNIALQSTQLTNLLFLARSMSVTLSSSPLQEMALDHIRACAGAYYLNTLIFTANKKVDAFMNTSQLESFCQALETAGEYASDDYLVKLVRIQQLTQSICITMAVNANQPVMQLPLIMIVHSFQQQINDYRQSLPPHLKENPTLLNHMGIAEVLVMDVAISDQHCNSSMIPLTDRLQLLWACVRSLRAFFDVRVGGRSFEKPRFLVIVASDLAYAIMTAMKLLMVKVPGWNPGQIVSELALYELLDNHVKELNDLIARRRGSFLSASEGAARDPIERLCKLLKYGKEVVDLQLRKIEAAEESSKDLPAGDGWMGEDFGDEILANFLTGTAWNETGDMFMNMV